MYVLQQNLTHYLQDYKNCPRIASFVTYLLHQRIAKYSSVFEKNPIHTNLRVFQEIPKLQGNLVSQLFVNAGSEGSKRQII